MSYIAEAINQNICNQCGIKPQIIQDYEMNDIELYPNFLESNNFVKLMELHFTKELTIGDYLQSYDGYLVKRWHDRKTFLKLLNDVLYYTSKSPRVRLMKKAIKNTKWNIEEVLGNENN